jgi:hypothetical protein
VAFPSIWPIDPPWTITGNYGELRPNHFHDGLDFSTNGQINLQVYAVEEGYVSRVRVSATGYGKSVYITHPNGKVTVYAHLNAFSLKIAEMIKKEQYAKKSFEIEIFPKSYQLPVRKGEIIGLSGNTGGSTGPHLHFEIRDEKSETPLNPLTFLKIKDITPPTIQKIGFYDLADTCSPQFIKALKLKTAGDKLVTETDTVIFDRAIIGFAFSGFDRYVANGNPNNIFSAALYMDGQLIYTHTLNKIDFSDNRYVNEFSEVIGGIKFQKCFLPTLYPQHMYGDCVYKGRIILSDAHGHQLQFIAKDESGNEQRLQLYVKTKQFNYYKAPAIKSGLFVNCNKDFSVQKNNLAVSIPAKTLFYSTPLILENRIETSGKLIILPAEVNLRSAATVGFKVSENLKRYKSKLVLKNGSAVYSPLFRHDSVFYAVKSFGTFQLGKDTIGPDIRTQLTARQLKKMASPAAISFVVKDAVSGLMNYHLYLNDVWVIGEYDAKYDLITYYFDEESPVGNLEFRLEAEDNVGNTSVFTCVLRK